MNRQLLRRLLIGWAVFITLFLLGVRSYVSLAEPKELTIVRSYWVSGRRIEREIVHDAKGPDPAKHPPNAQYADEAIAGTGPLATSWLFFDLGLVPGRDGVEATLDGKTVYATVDDLMSAQAYDRGHLWVEASFGWGTNKAMVLGILSRELGKPNEEILARATFRRVRFERRDWDKRPLSGGPVNGQPAHIEAKDLTPALVKDGLREAAYHLSRALDGGGHFRYMINAPDDTTIPGYNWPRHSGATFFLAQAAHLLDDGFVRLSALRAAARLRDEMMRPCGTHKCITEEQPVTEIGSSALALIAFTEIVRTGADASYKQPAAELADFLRSQQRPDGELMHFYDRNANKPIDVQLLYYSGEATLGLARAHAVNGDPRDLEAAQKILAHLSGSGWSFFGSRYYFGEEHWTCQAVAELWDRAPNRDALTFCSRWHEYQRRLQYSASDSPFDADGAFGFGPLIAPRVTPASSRGEAAGALLTVLLKEPGQHADEIPLVETELNRGLAFVLRSQLHPFRAPSYLYSNPVTIRGGLPGSPVDWQLRIDYAQHAGCMMARWLEIDGQKHGAAPPLHSAQ